MIFHNDLEKAGLLRDADPKRGLGIIDKHGSIGFRHRYSARWHLAFWTMADASEISEQTCLQSQAWESSKL